MILAGAFTESKLIAACAIPGAILAAAYMLRMLQKLIWGGTKNPTHTGLTDLNAREIITLAPLLLLVFWIGFGPKPFLNVMHASVANLLEQVNGVQTGVGTLAAKLMMP